MRPEVVAIEMTTCLVSAKRASSVGRAFVAMAAAGLAGFTSACAGSSEPGGVVSEVELPVWSGTAAAACEWPAVVGLANGCSATLVDPELVVYAAHCGVDVEAVSFGERLDAPARVVATRGCVAHPNAALGNGLDVAYCRLAEAVRDVPVARLAAGCELDSVRASTQATLVGFGFESDDGSFGTKRSAPVELASVGPDLVVDASRAGACSGDSGGALFAGAPGEARLIGVLSASKLAACGPNTDHYSYLPPLLPWLERSSGIDLTPCFTSDGAWKPTLACTEPASQLSGGTWESACGALTSESVLLATCGAPFAGETAASRETAAGRERVERTSGDPGCAVCARTAPPLGGYLMLVFVLSLCRNLNGSAGGWRPAARFRGIRSAP